MFDFLNRAVNDLANSFVNSLDDFQNLFGKELILKKKIKDNALDLIGNTPLIKLNKIGNYLDGIHFYLKAEFLNPTGSTKDRTALSMISNLERRFHLKKGDEIIYCNYSTTAIGLAWISKIKGYKFTIFLPTSTPETITKTLKRFDSNVILSSQSLKEVIEEYKIQRTNIYLLDEYTDMSNPNIHFLTTGPEIWSDLERKVDAFVASGGSGGTITGVGKFLKSKNSNIKVVMGTSVDSIYIKRRKEDIQLKEELPQTFDKRIVDEYFGIKRDEALFTQSEIYNKEGLIVGTTTAMTVAGALKFAESIQSTLTPKNYNIVILSPDRDS